MTKPVVDERAASAASGKTKWNGATAHLTPIAAKMNIRATKPSREPLLTIPSGSNDTLLVVRTLRIDSRFVVPVRPYSMLKPNSRMADANKL